MAKLSGNKGEWSEVYALCYLLAHGKIHAADENLNRLEDVFFPIMKVFRDEGDKHHKRYIEYQLPYLINAYNAYIGNINAIIKDGDDKQQTISVFVNEEFVCDISQSYIFQELEKLYHHIADSKGRTFSIDDAEQLIERLQCTKLSASSVDKADIGMELHDINTGYAPICGFSIKSDLGSPPTLLNASKATNFVFEVKNLSNQHINEINAINTKNKILDRMAAIYNYGGCLQFENVKTVFEDNLIMIDSRMPEILAGMLLYSFRTGCVDSEDIIDYLEKEDPLGYSRSGFYGYKYKKLLCSVALGMIPSKKWDGRDEANGGYIIVKKDGDVVAYHIYNRDKFEDYLLKNTKFERGSTTKHGFATLYTENSRCFINLNLQIRFK